MNNPYRQKATPHLTGLTVRTNRRHDRRALEPDEVRRLLEATISAPERFGMTGCQSAMLYRLAVETGLRTSELQSLTVTSFDFNKCTVTVEAAYSKHRREDVLPYGQAQRRSYGASYRVKCLMFRCSICQRNRQRCYGLI